MHQQRLGTTALVALTSRFETRVALLGSRHLVYKLHIYCEQSFLLFFKRFEINT